MAILFYEERKSPPMPRMRNSRSSAKARTGRARKACRLRDLSQRKRVELRRYLAQEPGTIAPHGSGVLAFPFAVAPMVLRLAD